MLPPPTRGQVRERQCLPPVRGSEDIPTSPAPCWGLDVAEPGAVARCPFVRPGECL